MLVLTFGPILASKYAFSPKNYPFHEENCLQLAVIQGGRPPRPLHPPQMHREWQASEGPADRIFVWFARGPTKGQIQNEQK